MDQNKYEKQLEDMGSFHSLTNMVQEKSTKKSNHHTRKQVCDDCGKSCRDKTDLKRHVNGVHLNIRHQCVFCDYSSGYKHIVKKHTKRMHKK